MSNHLPECPVPEMDGLWGMPLHPDDAEANCICDRLRACEQRVRLEMALTHEREWIEARDAGYEAGLKATHEDPNILASYSWSQGYAAGLDAAREVVAATVNDPNDPKFVRTDYQCCGTSAPEYMRDDALAAIDALRGEL